MCWFCTFTTCLLPLLVALPNCLYPKPCAVRSAHSPPTPRVKLRGPAAVAGSGPARPQSLRCCGVCSRPAKTQLPLWTLPPGQHFPRPSHREEKREGGCCGCQHGHARRDALRFGVENTSGLRKSQPGSADSVGCFHQKLQERRRQHSQTLAGSCSPLTSGATLGLSAAPPLPRVRIRNRMELR